MSQDDLSNIKELLGSIKDKIVDQNKRIEALEKKFEMQSVNKVSIVDPYAENAPPPPPPPLYQEGKEEKEEREKEQEPVKLTTFEREDSEPIDIQKSPTVTEEKSLEEKIGGGWFAKIGVVVIVLGVSFFLKYAFDNNWIGVTGRVIMGMIAGIALLAFGEKTIRKYFSYGQIVTGGGLAIMYLSIFAGFNFYDVIPQIPAFIFMALITATGIALSLRYNAPSLIIFSTLGGFLTPMMISSGQNQQLALFAYVIILDLAVLAVSFVKKWRWLNIIGFVGTFFLFNSWFSHFYDKTQIWSTFTFLTIFFLIYSISSLSYNLVKKEESEGTEQVLTLVNGLVYFVTSYFILNPLYHSYMGLFAFVIAVYFFMWATFVKSVTPKDENLYGFLAFLSIGFLTLMFPLIFENQPYIITISWMIEATLITSLGIKLKGQNSFVIRVLGLIVFALGLIRVISIDYFLYDVGDMIFLNKVFVSSLVAIIATYSLYVMSAKSDKQSPDEVNTKSLAKLTIVFLIIANLLTVFSISREVDTYFAHQKTLEYQRANQQNQEIFDRYGRNAEYSEDADRVLINKYGEMSTSLISIFILIYSALLALLGVYRKNIYLIYLSIVMFLVLMAKVFIDMWDLDTVYRPLSTFISVFVAYFMAVIMNEYRKSGKSDKHINAVAFIILFILIANIMTVFAGSREIFKVYDNNINQQRNQFSEQCNSSRYSPKSIPLSMGINGGALDSEQCNLLRANIKKLENRASITISIFWLLYSIGLLAVGFIKKNKYVRQGGIALLIISILKLFFMDLWSLGQLYRIISSISLGLVLLGISFIYQKYSKEIKEMIN